MDTRIKYIPDGTVYENRREAKREMGHFPFNRALHNGLMMFVTSYAPTDIII